jgi:hypothetical protein
MNVAFRGIQHPAVRTGERAPVLRAATHVLIAVESMVARSAITVGYGAMRNEVLKRVLEILRKYRIVNI